MPAVTCPRPAPADRFYHIHTSIRENKFSNLIFILHKWLMFFDKCAIALPIKTHLTGEFHEAI